MNGAYTVNLDRMTLPSTIELMGDPDRAEPLTYACVTWRPYRPGNVEVDLLSCSSAVLYAHAATLIRAADMLQRLDQ